MLKIPISFIRLKREVERSVDQPVDPYRVALRPSLVDGQDISPGRRKIAI
jgi:hypothetical protein